MIGLLTSFRSRYFRGELWKHRDFLKLWTGETISLMGDYFTGLAVPFIATFIILKDVDQHAAAVPLGILAACLTAPFLFFGLIVGVWVDRHRPRRIMMAADLARLVLVALIPIGALLNFLGMSLLYFVAFFHGVFTVFFDVAYQAYIPALVERNQIVDANAKLETTRSTAQIFGPSLAGVAIRTITAPLSMTFDALSFLASFLFLNRIRRHEQKPKRVPGSTLLGEAREGLRVVFGDSRLRSIAGCTATLNFFGNVGGAIFFLYLNRYLGFTNDEAPLLIGFLGSIGGVGALMGALSAGRLAGRVGVGRAIILAALLAGLSNLGVAVATHNTAALLFAGTQLAGSIANVVYNINQVSFRQALVPLRLQGRMNATMRFIVWGTLPLGALTGGLLGQALGVFPATLIGAGGGLLGFLWVLFSPVRHLKTMPEPAA